MISKEKIKYSLSNIVQRKSRNFLTILSIFVGIATIFIFISFGLGLFSYINGFATGGAADKITVQTRGVGAPGLDDTFKLENSDLAVVDRTIGVKEATGTYFKTAEVVQGKTKKFVFLIAYDPDKPLIIEISNIEIVKGRELKKDDVGKTVLGYNYQIPNRIFPKAIKLNDKIEVEGQKLRVIGFFEQIGNPHDDSNIYIPNDYIDNIYPNEELSFGLIVARSDIRTMDLVTERIEKNLRKHRDQEEGKEDFFAVTFVDQLEAFSGALSIIVIFIVFIALISVAVSAVNTANTMVTSVLERTKEIGIIKSIGATNIEVFNIFLFESSFLGFTAGVIGVLIGWFLSFTAGIILNNLGWGFLTPIHPWYLFIIGILFATLTGSISGVLPAISAAKLNPVEALRYE